MIIRERAEEVFCVASYESDFTGHLAVHSLFNRFQELAGRHAAFLGVGFDKLREKGMAWVLSRIKVEIDTLPRWGETVTLQTWPKGVDRLFALRDFKVQNEQGETMVRATTCWLLVDREKGKPCRIQVLDADLNFPHAVHAIREVPDKIAVPGPLVPALEVPVLPSDLDVNDHVNNAHYARWVTDSFAVEQSRTRSVKMVQINYLKQVLNGDFVTLSIGKGTETQNAQYLEGINNTDGSAAFHALVEWR